jgi:hypothetical protein
MTARILLALACAAISASAAAAQQVPHTTPQHFIFFARERARISEPGFISNPNIAGAELKYTWRELEPTRDHYDFTGIAKDLATLQEHDKRLWIQLQDASFSETQVVPDYLLTDVEFNGGVARQYEDGRFAGLVTRRWDPAVRERYQKLLNALGHEFDGKIEGLNFAETSAGFDDDRPFPAGFTYAGYAAGVQAIMTAAKAALPRSHVIVYANFMPGESLPDNDRGYLRGIYAHAERIGVGVGGPDILPLRPWQQKHSLPLIRARKSNVIAGMAVQDGNLVGISVSELLRYLDYIFWGTEEPYYSRDVLPFLRFVSKGTRS